MRSSEYSTWKAYRCLHFRTKSFLYNESKKINNESKAINNEFPLVALFTFCVPVVGFGPRRKLSRITLGDERVKGENVIFKPYVLF